MECVICKKQLIDSTGCENGYEVLGHYEYNGLCFCCECWTKEPCPKDYRPGGYNAINTGEDHVKQL